MEWHQKSQESCNPLLRDEDIEGDAGHPSVFAQSDWIRIVSEPDCFKQDVRVELSTDSIEGKEGIISDEYETSKQQSCLTQSSISITRLTADDLLYNPLQDETGISSKRLRYLLNRKIANDILYDLKNNSRLQEEVFETINLSDGRWKVLTINLDLIPICQSQTDETGLDQIISGGECLNEEQEESLIKDQASGGILAVEPGAGLAGRDGHMSGFLSSLRQRKVYIYTEVSKAWCQRKLEIRDSLARAKKLIHNQHSKAGTQQEIFV